MGHWTETFTKLLGVGNGTVRRTSPSPQMSVAGRQRTREPLPTRPTNSRAASRFHVQLRTVVSDAAAETVLDGNGTILDLSLGGCRIEAPCAMEPHLLVELRIHIPDLDWPLMVDGAVVQWVKGHTFGLRFLRLRPKESDRLARVIAELAQEEDL